MKIKLVGILLFSYFILTSQTLVNGENKDYLSTGDQLTFLNENYELVWSSNPITGYYKQEYLRSKDKLTKFSKMLIIDAVESNISADEAARLKSKCRIPNQTVIKRCQCWRFNKTFYFQ